MEIIRLADVGVEKAAARAAKVLQAGGLVLYPTDTLYGLGVDATNPRALTALREVKGREKKKPISVLVPDVASISTYAQMNARAKVLAEKFFPGALTLVMPATAKIPQEITLNGAIGIRIPDDPFCRALSRAFGKPITATSANKSGREVPPTISDIITQLGHESYRIALAIDDGSRAGGIPSTVVRATDDGVHILREGELSKAELGI